MVRLLADLAGLSGALFIILGAFFLYAGLTRDSEQPRLAALIGLLFLATGVSSILTWYTGGVALYLLRGGSPVVGWTVVYARVASSILALFSIIDSLLIWWESTQHAERKLK